jgi:hypothetical protein
MTPSWAQTLNSQPIVTAVNNALPNGLLGLATRVGDWALANAVNMGIGECANVNASVPGVGGSLGAVPDR